MNDKYRLSKSRRKNKDEIENRDEKRGCRRYQETAIEQVSTLPKVALRLLK